MYFVNTDNFETLCVPDVKGSAGESIRYHIFLGMHDSLFYGHRGVQSPHASMRQKVYWPKFHKEVVLSSKPVGHRGSVFLVFLSKVFLLFIHRELATLRPRI